MGYGNAASTMANDATWITSAAARMAADASAAGAGAKRGAGVVVRLGSCSIGKVLSWGANGLAARSITWSARGKPCASRVGGQD